MKLRNLGPAALITTAALVLTGCNADASNEGSADASELSGTLTFASWLWEAPVRGELAWDVVSAYAEENPGVTLRQQGTTRADFEKTMSTQIGAGGGPDILHVPDTFFDTLAEAGALEPLNDVLATDDAETLRPNNGDYEVDGDQLSLIWNVTPYTLFWNTEVTDAAGAEPPATFEELVDAAVAVKEETGKTGFVVRHQMNEESVWWTDFANWPYGFGGGWSENGELTINRSENIEAAEAFKEIYDSGAFGIGDDASTYRSKFGSDEVGFVIDNSAALSSIVADNEVVPSTDVAASVLPFPGGSSANTVTAMGINANSENKELAKDFMRWLFTDEVQSKLVDAVFPSGTGTSATASQELIEANPWVEAFNEQLDDSQSSKIKGFEAETPQISHIVLSQIQRMLLSDISAKEALDAAQAEALALVG